jgi:hypothetical protein
MPLTKTQKQRKSCLRAWVKRPKFGKELCDLAQEEQTQLFAPRVYSGQQHRIRAVPAKATPGKNDFS